MAANAVRGPSEPCANDSVERLHDVNATAAAIEFHKAVDQSEERIVAALADTVSRLKDRANLPYQNISGPNGFSAKPLHATTLGIRVTTVSARSLTFLMCHQNT
jgi:hypothetical protein